MGTFIGNIAPGASPSQEDFRVFETQSALNTYLSSARAKAGQTVKLKDTATGKYKAYITFFKLFLIINIIRKWTQLFKYKK